MPVPEAEPVLSAVQVANDPAAAHGIPAHVTILFPFAPLELVDETALAELVSAFPVFDFTLDRIEHFGDVVWLHPEPSWRFIDLTAAVSERWPDYPPYEGAFDEVIPHLTVSVTPIEIDVGLPIACRAREVVLIEELERDGSWTVRRRFALGAAQAGVA